jgi:hypothetical protein
MKKKAEPCVEGEEVETKPQTFATSVLSSLEINSSFES